MTQRDVNIATFLNANALRAREIMANVESTVRHSASLKPARRRVQRSRHFSRMHVTTV